MSTYITIQKPKKVSSAINLLIVSIVLGVVNFIIGEMTTDIHEVTNEMKNYSSGMSIFTSILSFALMSFLIYKMNRRKKWARTTFLVFVILGAFFVILGALVYPQIMITMYKSRLVVGVLAIILNILQIISLTMIYSKTGNEWFNLKSNLPITGA